MSGSHLDPGSKVVLFVIITLILGMVAKEINKRIGIPYTPLLIILGGILGAAQEFGDITQSTDSVLKIEPHSILIILIPLLIFESAYNSHTEVLAKNFWQVMLLIGPGVLVQVFFLSFIFYIVLGYGGSGHEDMSFNSCLAVGSILATTDPVAVVALLKELGSPLHIETLIEMESLFNDGAAVVFFNIFVKLAKGESISAGDGIGQFFLLAFGGPALGVAFGLGCIILFKIFTRGTTLFITTVFVVAYVSFFTAEKFAEGKVSGLLSLVLLGIVMNVSAKDYMTNRQKAAVQQILSYLQFMSETILFFMSGVFIGDILIYKPSKGGAENYIKGDDWWKLVVLYIFLNIGRFLMFMLFLWPLKKLGEGMTWKETIFAVWGGLRGALALALALIIYAEESEPEGINKRTQSLILFHTCGIVTMTLLINGTTCAHLVDYLGIISNKVVKTKFKHQYLKEVKEEGNKQREALNANAFFELVEWKGVDELINLKELEQKQGFSDSVNNNHDFKKREKKSGHKRLIKHESNVPHLTLGIADDSDSARNKSGKNGSNAGSSDENLKFKKLKTFKDKVENQVISYEKEEYQKIRYRFLRIFMKTISSTKSKEWISNKVFQLVFDAAEENAEKLKHPIKMWHHLTESMASDSKLNLMYKMRNNFKIVDYWFHLELEFIHEMVYVFTTCINEAKTFMKENSVSIHFNNVRKTQEMNVIMSEIDEDFELSKAYMRKIKKNYYEVLGKLEQRKAAIKIIMAQAKMVDEHINNHYIPEKEGNEIKNYLSGKIEKLNSIQTLVKLTSQSEDKIEIFFRDSLDPNDLKHLIQGSSPQKFEPGEQIIAFDEEADYIYYIAQGEIQETFFPIESDLSNEKKTVVYTHGQVVGMTNLVDPDEKSLITLTATEETNVLALPITELREYYFNNGKFEEFCIKKCLYQFLHLSQKNSPLWDLWGVKNVDEINKVAQESVCRRLTVDDPIRLEFGGYMFSGQLVAQDGSESVEPYSLVPAGQYYIAKDISLILEFKRQRGKTLLEAIQIEQQNKEEGNKTKGHEHMTQSHHQNKQEGRKMSTGTAKETPKGSMIIDQNVQNTYQNFGGADDNHNPNQLSNKKQKLDQSKDQTACHIKVHNNQKQMQGGLQKSRKGKSSENDEEDIVNIKNKGCAGDDAVEADGVESSVLINAYHNKSIRNHEYSIVGNKHQQENCDSNNNSLNDIPGNLQAEHRKPSVNHSQYSLHDRRNSVDMQKQQVIIDKLNNNNVDLQKIKEESAVQTITPQNQNNYQSQVSIKNKKSNSPVNSPKSKGAENNLLNGEQATNYND